MTKSLKIFNQLRPKGGRNGMVPAKNVRHQRQCEVIRLFGTIKFESDFNVKAERAKR